MKQIRGGVKRFPNVIVELIVGRRDVHGGGAIFRLRLRVLTTQNLAIAALLGSLARTTTAEACFIFYFVSLAA
jgi:hypothetical protein